MRRYALIATVVVAMAGFGLAGCDGGGDGIAARAQLQGTWEAFSAALDGTAVPLAEAVAEEQDASVMRVELGPDGTLTVRYLDLQGEVVATETGTWDATAGQLTINSGEESVTFSYDISDNILHTRETDDGHQVDLRWARVVDLQGHDPDLIRTWAVDFATADGEIIAARELFNFPESAASVAVQVRDDGIAVIRGLQEGAIHALGYAEWATGGGEIALGLPNTTLRGAYLISGRMIQFRDTLGRSAALYLEPFAPDAPHDARLPGTWAGNSVTVDGTETSFGDYFGDAEADGMAVQYWADGTALLELLSDGTPIAGHLGTWSADDGSFDLDVGYAQIDGTYVIEDGTATVRYTEFGSEIVLSLQQQG